MYQYVPSKESLIVALYERENEVASRAVLDLIAALGTEDLPRLLEGFIEWTFDYIGSKPGLNRVLFDEVPRLTGLAETLEVNLVMAKHVRSLLSLDEARLRPRNLDLAALLVVSTFRYSIMGATLDSPPEGEARKAFVRELTDLLSCYLLSPRPWRSD
jgi:AcrR family transcriptional regulator